jgi:glycosyltransferase involved in cell wall biosynthesis
MELFWDAALQPSRRAFPPRSIPWIASWFMSRAVSETSLWHSRPAKRSWIACRNSHERERISSAQISAIGALSDVELKYFDWDKKAYDSIPVHEQVDVASLFEATSPLRRTGSQHFTSILSSADEVGPRSPVTSGGPSSGGYLAFMGRIAPEKGPVDAIHLAQRLGIPVKIAAKVDKVDEAYFREAVQPLLSTEGVEFIGEINEREKGPLLREASALLFPICWPEPFGLVMIEAMAADQLL